MIAIFLWGAIAIFGLWRQGIAWRRASCDVKLWESQRVDFRAIVMRSNERRRFFWRTLISGNNLLLAIAFGLASVGGHLHTPWWLGLVYFPTSLIANEGIVILLTELDEHARRRVVRLTNAQISERLPN